MSMGSGYGKLGRVEQGVQGDLEHGTTCGLGHRSIMQCLQPIRTSLDHRTDEKILSGSKQPSSNRAERAAEG